jgi:hypothetical protein
MKMSPLIVVLWCIAHGAAAADTTYRDRRQPSFTLLVPDGWTATPTNEGVTIASGGDAFHLNVQPGAHRPGEVLVSLRPQFQRQLQGFRELASGGLQFGGQTGGFAVYAGTPPSGISGIDRIVTMTDGRLTFTAFESFKDSEAAQARPALARIEASFTPDPVR